MPEIPQSKHRSVRRAPQRGEVRAVPDPSAPVGKGIGHDETLARQQELSEVLVPPAVQ